MQLPQSVDLRSAYDEVYNQGSDNSCGAFAITALLDCMFERATNVKHRFEKNYIWNWSKWHRGINSTENIGMDFVSAESTLRLNGAKLIYKDNADVQEIIKGFKLVRSSISGVTGLREKLAMGMPLLYTINVPLVFGNGTNWRTHTVEFNKQFTGGLHYVAMIGYDDSCQRYLFENSWGKNWGDGGFFGVPYEQATNPFFMQGIDQIDIAPVLTKPYEDYKMPAFLNTMEKYNFIDRAAPALLEMLINELQANGVQGLINMMIKFGISDKHLEQLQKWDRGQVRIYKDQNPQLNWDGFIWDQL